MSGKEVFLKNNIGYSLKDIYEYLDRLDLFSEKIVPGDTVVIKPNWVKEHHMENDDWDYIITHPVIIEAVLLVTLKRLAGKGKIIITDGPQTDSSFKKIIMLMDTDKWKRIAEESGVELEILDLRDEEWECREGVIINKKVLNGDPHGSVEINLDEAKSEFYTKKRPPKGYHGAGPDLAETNRAHNGHDNIYRVSRTVIEADVFINVPKLKTHKKAGITCCLKNLVGINTYKNYLPHHSEGTPSEGGDQFAKNILGNRLERYILSAIKSAIKDNMVLARIFVPFKVFGKKIFGDTEEKVRSGNWYGNDTVWRMILDLNKVLFYGNTDNTLREDIIACSKKYIGVVDAIKAGEGRGPMSPDLFEAGFLAVGTNPLAIDCCCAKLMGFDFQKIPMLANAFFIKEYKVFRYSYDDIRIVSEDRRYNTYLKEIKKEDVFRFQAHFGWKGHIEL